RHCHSPKRRAQQMRRRAAKKVSSLVKKHTPFRRSLSFFARCPRLPCSSPGHHDEFVQKHEHFPLTIQKTLSSWESLSTQGEQKKESKYETIEAYPHVQRAMSAEPSRPSVDWTRDIRSA